MHSRPLNKSRKTSREEPPSLARAHPLTAQTCTPTQMATRQRQAEAADARATKQAALRTLEGQPLPLPSERRTEPPAEPSAELAAEITDLGAAGLTETQIADHLAMTADALASMGKGHIEIGAALSRARTAAQAWWEEQARRALITENNRFPAGAWAQVMKARFAGYDDKAQVNVSFDLGSLVVVRLDEPEPPRERVAPDAKALIDHDGIRLITGPTVEGNTEAKVIPAPGSGDDPQ